MSVVTFWNSEKEETGKTMEIIAISTYLAIEHNYKILIISTTERKNDVIKYFEVDVESIESIHNHNAWAYHLESKGN